MNDTLGVRLGMPLDEFKRTRKTESHGCGKEDADGQVFCTITIPPVLDLNAPTLRLGGAVVSSYQLWFYERKLITIHYDLSVIDMGLLESAFEEKFGVAGTRKADPLRWREWKNATSSMVLGTDDRHVDSAYLALRLDKENDEWLDRYRKRQNAEAKQGL
jgi:hypothetical protein